jgi:hypothetical protein
MLWAGHLTRFDRGFLGRVLEGIPLGVLKQVADLRLICALATGDILDRPKDGLAWLTRCSTCCRTLTLVTLRGRQPVAVKVLDFGLVKLAVVGDKTTATRK